MKLFQNSAQELTKRPCAPRELFGIGDTALQNYLNPSFSRFAAFSNKSLHAAINTLAGIAAQHGTEAAAELSPLIHQLYAECLKPHPLAVWIKNAARTKITAHQATVFVTGLMERSHSARYEISATATALARHGYCAEAALLMSNATEELGTKNYLSHAELMFESAHILAEAAGFLVPSIGEFFQIQKILRGRISDHPQAPEFTNDRMRHIVNLIPPELTRYGLEIEKLVLNLLQTSHANKPALSTLAPLLTQIALREAHSANYHDAASQVDAYEQFAQIFLGLAPARQRSRIMAYSQVHNDAKTGKNCWHGAAEIGHAKDALRLMIAALCQLDAETLYQTLRLATNLHVARNKFETRLVERLDEIEAQFDRKSSDMLHTDSDHMLPFFPTPKIPARLVDFACRFLKPSPLSFPAY